MPIARAAVSSSIFAATVVAVFTVYSTPAAAGCSDSPRKGVNWDDCRKRNLILKGVDLQDASLKGTDFTSTDLRDSNFDGADLTKANMLKSHLDDASLVGANFDRVLGFRTQFHRTDLSNSSFEKAEMQRADFAGSKIHNVNFSKAELGRANFDAASLEDVNFDYAILARADFRGAELGSGINFSSAYLFLTRFDGQDLSNSSGLTQQQIELACGDSDTVMPAGLERPSSWPCDDDAVN